MLDAFRKIGGRDVPVLGLRSGGILPKTLSESGAKVACAAESRKLWARRRRSAAERPDLVLWRLAE